ncbi:DsbA family oxidoreductase [Actinokineospora inagensis]|uniref:DsbA family oxidoreductase n=1 Tax=Actinokineospora inagensis TaxID=103730 RepID=UPI0003F4B297|nr:DsbA family protein [Actinokineospora inagensis]
MTTDPRLPTTPDTVVVFSDLNCSFAHLGVYRLHKARRELGLDGRLWFDHRAFPLELFNRSVNARTGVDSEIAVLGGIEPEAGWRMWQGPDWTYPVTTLPALEAVQAAKAQSWAASEALDLALRVAFWSAGRTISMRHVILDVAAETGVVDVPALATALDDGRARRHVMTQFAVASEGRVNCSPHVFLYDGTNEANPGVTAHWANGEFGSGFPVIDSDDPGIYERLLKHAAGLLPG